MKREGTEPEVVHQVLPANPRFSGVIRRVLTSSASEAGTIQLPVPPTGSIYLNALIQGRVKIAFRDGSQLDANPLYIGGQILRETLIAQIQTPLLIVGLEFEATGFHRLFGIDASTLTDRLTPFDAVHPSAANRLSRKLTGLDHSDTIAETMQLILSDCLPPEGDRSLASRAAGVIEARGGRLDIADLAKELSVSERHLRRSFTVAVGISPKAYAKTVQLNEVIGALQSGNTDMMHNIALNHGYYDQAHFVRDFSRMVGNNPTAFLASRDPFLSMFLGRTAQS